MKSNMEIWKYGKKGIRKKFITLLLYYFITLLFLLLYYFITLSDAAFLDPGWTARATGVGGAFTSLSNDANGIFWNPAGIAQSREIQATFMYAKPYSGLELYAGPDKTNLGMNCGTFIYPLKKWGSIGFGVTSLSVSDVYIENMYIISYALSGKRINEFFKKFQPDSQFGAFEGFKEKKQKFSSVKPAAYLGINIKYLNHKYIPDRYTESDPVFEGGTSKGVISLDFGVLVLYNKLSLGLALRDLNQPDAGLKDEDKVPMEARIGAGLHLGKFVPSLDFSYRDKLFNFHSGVEYSLKSFVFRGGVNMDEVAAGFGFCSKLLLLDYSFTWPFTIMDSYGSHRISLTVRFGRVEEEIETKKIRTKKLKPKKFKRKK